MNDNQHVSLRFVLSSENCGGLIGKGGSTIKRLREQYNADVKLPDSHTKDRVLSISAARVSALNCLRDCLQNMKYPPYPQIHGNKTIEHEVNMLVQGNAAGGIIGPSGSRINELRTSTQTLVKMYPDRLPMSTERVLAIAAENADDLIKALNQTLDLMAAHPPKNSAPGTEYDPVNAHMAVDYAQNSLSQNRNDRGRGRGGAGRGGPGRGGPGRGGFRGGRGGGYANGGGMYGGGYPPHHGMGYGQGNMGGGMGMGGPPPYGGGMPFGGPPQGGGHFGGYPSQHNQMNGAPSGMQGAAPPPSGPPTSLMNQSFERKSIQVTIPDEYAGAIIGRGGMRIQMARDQSGAEIKMEELKPGEKERLINITGTDNQCEHAQFLMQQAVREFAQK